MIFTSGSQEKFEQLNNKARSSQEGPKVRFDGLEETESERFNVRRLRGRNIFQNNDEVASVASWMEAGGRSARLKTINNCRKNCRVDSHSTSATVTLFENLLQCFPSFSRPMTLTAITRRGPWAGAGAVASVQAKCPPRARVA